MVTVSVQYNVAIEFGVRIRIGIPVRVRVRQCKFAIRTLVIFSRVECVAVYRVNTRSTKYRGHGTAQNLCY